MGGIKSELNLALMMVKRQQIIGLVLRSRLIAEKARIIRQFHQIKIGYVAGQSIILQLSDIFPLSEAADMHRAMQQSFHFGKNVLKV